MPLPGESDGESARSILEAALRRATRGRLAATEATVVEPSMGTVVSLEIDPVKWGRRRLGTGSIGFILGLTGGH